MLRDRYSLSGHPPSVVFGVPTRYFKDLVESGLLPMLVKRRKEDGLSSHELHPLLLILRKNNGFPLDLLLGVEAAYRLGVVGSRFLSGKVAVRREDVDPTTSGSFFRRG